MGRGHKLETLGFNTRAINEGHKPDKETGAIVPPIFLSTTYDQNNVKELKYFYSRGENPTRFSLEEVLASLENAKHCLTFSSGQAAGMAVLNTELRPGDHVLSINDIYGGTRDLFDTIQKYNEIHVDYYSSLTLDDIDNFISPKTKLIWVETPANPTLKLVDIAKACEIAKKHGIKVLVDNTFLSPVLQNPLEFKADYVLHSTTKYLSGHQDVIGGAIMLNDTSNYEGIKSYQKIAGAVPSPFDCWLTHRGLKTLGIRMEKHVANANEIANFLEKNKKIKKVLYPGLKSFPQFTLAKKQMKDAGGIISFYCHGDAQKLVSNLKLFANAVSLGGVKSLICIPAFTTHRLTPEKVKQELGITSSLLRLSVGIEDSIDLIQDLEQAISKS